MWIIQGDQRRMSQTHNHTPTHPCGPLQPSEQMAVKVHQGAIKLHNGGEYTATSQLLHTGHTTATQNGQHLQNTTHETQPTNAGDDPAHLSCRSRMPPHWATKRSTVSRYSGTATQVM